MKQDNYLAAFLTIAIVAFAAQSVQADDAAQDPAPVRDAPAAEERASAVLTVKDFKETTAEEQSGILRKNLATMKRQLWSESFPNGEKKPDELLAQNRQIVLILEKLFDFSDPDVIPDAYINLYNAIYDADEDLPVANVILTHIREVIQRYERDSQNASPAADAASKDTAPARSDSSEAKAPASVLTVEDFDKQSPARQMDFIIAVIDQIMEGLKSPDHDGEPKPENVREEHFRMAFFINNLFFLKDDDDNVTVNEDALRVLFWYFDAYKEQQPDTPAGFVVSHFLTDEYQKHVDSLKGEDAPPAETSEPASRNTTPEKVTS